MQHSQRVARAPLLTLACRFASDWKVNEDARKLPQPSFALGFAPHSTQLCLVSVTQNSRITSLWSGGSQDRELFNHVCVLAMEAYEVCLRGWLDYV